MGSRGLEFRSRVGIDTGAGAIERLDGRLQPVQNGVVDGRQRIVIPDGDAKIPPPLVMRRRDEGTGSIGVSVRLMRGGTAAAAAGPDRSVQACRAWLKTRRSRSKSLSVTSVARHQLRHLH